MTREKSILVLDSLSTWLGYERPITEEIIEAIKTLSQSFLPSDLDEVAKEYYFSPACSWEDNEERFINAFKAGAEWMAEQGSSFNTKVGWIDGPTILDWPDDVLDKFEMGNEVIVQIRKNSNYGLEKIV